MVDDQRLALHRLRVSTIDAIDICAMWAEDARRAAQDRTDSVEAVTRRSV
jgi:hypothetical protein